MLPSVTGDSTLRYMTRFSCIGPACEDNCCHDWKVSVDHATHEKLLKAAALSSSDEAKRLRRALRTTPPKSRRYLPTHEIRLRDDGNCPMLEADGMCHIHAAFGPSFLPDVCAVFPRRIQAIGDHHELSGMLACPEVARQLLNHADAIEASPIPDGALPRPLLSDGMDPRDIRPYWRMLLDVRSFLLSLLRDRKYTLEQQLFLMTWFTKRTQSLFVRAATAADVAAVQGELELLLKPDLRDEISRRFDTLETPNSIVLILASEISRWAGPSKSREAFRAIVESVIRSLDRTVVWDEYRARKARISARAPARVEQYFRNFSFNYWLHRLPSESPDLLSHLLRMLAEMAVLKFLFFAHPRVRAALDDPDDDAFGGVLDQVVVEVFFRTARYIEHSTMMHELTTVLAHRQLASIAGAVYLVKF
jgi:lysine-N-methylase